MQYLITGGSGFIGKRLTDALLNTGHGVTYTGRTRSSNMDARAAFFPWDGQSAPPIDSMARLDGVFHLAGEPVSQRWNAEVKERILRSRVQSTQLLVSAIGRLRHKPPVLVSASAIGYYGDRGEEMLTETALPGTGFLADVCREWESAAHDAEQFGLRVVPVRIAVVLGEGGGALPPMLKVFRSGLGGPIAGGHQWMSWIHVSDLVRMLQFAVGNPLASGPMNGASPAPVTNAEFTRELASAVHRPAILPVPLFALRLAMGEMAENVVASARVLPHAAEQLGFQFSFPALRPCLDSILNGAQSSETAKTRD